MTKTNTTDPDTVTSSPQNRATRLPYFASQADMPGADPYAGLDSLEGVPSDAHSEAQRLRIVVVGHVDHGKSTLIGRIFHDTGAMPEGKEAQIRAACAAEGMPFEWAFLLDALLEEQEQNITIDTTRIPFRTRKRQYEIIDAPGHKEFLKNMVTGAASADAAVLVIAANEGVKEQSRRHGYLLRLLGVKQVVVAVNKMDTVRYDADVYDRVVDEYTQFLAEIGVTAQRFVPISARDGDNVAETARTTMGWYTGATILETLDGFNAAILPDSAPLRFITQDIYRFDARRLIAGRVESGKLRAGDTLTFYPGNRTAKIKAVERWNSPNTKTATAGDAILLTLEDQIFAERGHIATLSGAANPPSVGTHLRANLFWLGDDLKTGETVKLRLATQEIGARIVSIDGIVDAATLEKVTRDTILKNDVAEVTIETDKAVAFDAQTGFETTGRFVLVHNRRVAGGGILISGAEAAQTHPRNIVWNPDAVTVTERTGKNGHRGAVIWLTGLSGSGKSTIANAVNRALWEQGWQSTVLDGDNLRHGLNSDLGFTETDRNENVRRAGAVATLFAQAGLVTLCAFISPFAADREAARASAAGAGVLFVEVFLDTPLEVAESRDVKGLYKRARAGEIPNFTGISSPYEPPANPDVHIRTENMATEDSARILWDAVRAAAQIR